MTFANPLLLWALLLGFIPILIYYLLRFRSLKVTWGANYVLERALDRMKNRVNLDQLILMSLRVLACMFIVLAFARPIFRTDRAVASGTGIHHVIVLDGSTSMLAGAQNRRRFDASVDALKKLVNGWGRGETWSLLLLTDEPKWVIDGQAFSSPEEAARVIDTLRPGECSTSLATALNSITQKMPRGNIEIFIFADDQALTWDQVDRFKMPAELSAATYWLNVSGESKQNLAVTSLQPAADRILVNHPFRITASLKNFSGLKAEDVNVELLIDGAFTARQSVSLLPNQESTIHFDTKLTAAGSHHFCVQLPEDALDFDNRHFAAIEAVEKLTVVELRDPGKAGKFDSTWGAIETLERSKHTNKGSAAPAGQIVWKLNEGICDKASLVGIDVVMVDGGRKLTPELTNTLRDFVQSGGGLVLIADPNIDQNSWNDLLNGAALLPGQIGKLRTDALGGDRFRSLSRGNIAHSPLRIFESPASGDLSQARIYSSFEVRAKPQAINVIQFDDQTPWALRGNLPDGGNTLLIASSLSGQGNNLLVREFFVPLITQLMQDAAAGAVFPRTVARGQSIRLRVSNSSTTAFFSKQDQEPVSIPMRVLHGAPVAETSGNAVESGLYSILALTDGAGPRVWFGVQGPRSDSDLSPMPPAYLDAVTHQLNLSIATDWPSLEQELQKKRNGQEWQSWVILAVLVLLLGEMIFQRRFSPEPPRRRGVIASRKSGKEPQPV